MENHVHRELRLTGVQPPPTPQKSKEVYPYDAVALAMSLLRQASTMNDDELRPREKNVSKSLYGRRSAMQRMKQRKRSIAGRMLEGETDCLSDHFLDHLSEHRLCFQADRYGETASSYFSLRLGVYEFCNSTGPPRFHAIFASAPGEEAGTIAAAFSISDDRCKAVLDTIRVTMLAMFATGMSRVSTCLNIRNSLDVSERRGMQLWLGIEEHVELNGQCLISPWMERRRCNGECSIRKKTALSLLFVTVNSALFRVDSMLPL